MNNEQSTLIQQHSKYKIVFLGDVSVGKTSLVQQILHGSIQPIYQPTICLQSAKKLITHNNHLYKLMLWDTAGQQKYHSLIPSFIRGSHCIIILFDVTNQHSLANCQKWFKMLQNLKTQKLQQPYSLLLVGNKIDLQRSIAFKDGFQLAIKYGIDYIQVSSKTGEGVQNLIETIVLSIQKIKNKSQKQTKSSQGETTHKIFLSQSHNRHSNQVKVKIHQHFHCCCFI